MSKRTLIQTCGSYHPDEDYSLTVCFNDYHTMTLEGLTKEDLEELKSCIECLLLEDSETPNY